jgi:polyhydroxyalkanoate synthesis repressor PhaR
MGYSRGQRAAGSVPADFSRGARAAMAKAKPDSDEPVVIKKYANRRLYNTATSSYVTLDDLCDMVKAGEEFVVYDAKSGEDITRSVLTQIIFEQETHGQNLLPISFLRQLIGFYDDRLRALVPSYLEVVMENFARNQEQMRVQVEAAFGDLFPVRQMNELGRQNMEMFRKALGMFTPLAGADATPERDEAASAAQPGHDREIRELKEQLARMQRQLDSLADGD